MPSVSASLAIWAMLKLSVLSHVSPCVKETLAVLTAFVKIPHQDRSASVEVAASVTPSEDVLATTNKRMRALRTDVELTQCAKWIGMEVLLAIVHLFTLTETLT